MTAAILTVALSVLPAAASPAFAQASNTDPADLYNAPRSRSAPPSDASPPASRSAVGPAKPEDADDAALAPWKGEAAARIRSRARYPATRCKPNCPEGRVMAVFRVSRSGKLLESSISATSGSPVLDQEALRAIRRSSPFAPLPANAAISTLKVFVPIRFTPGR